jgi:hypothetical protein
VESGKTLDLGRSLDGRVGNLLLFDVVQGFLVERYWPGVNTSSVGGSCDSLDVAVRESSGVSVHFLGATLVVADEVVLFEFEAADRDEVIDLCQRAGIRCDRLVTVDYLGRRSVRRTQPGDQLGS